MMDVRAYRRKNRWRIFWERITHPWPLYKKQGGLDIVVTRANGTKERLGKVANVYSRRWGVRTK